MKDHTKRTISIVLIATGSIFFLVFGYLLFIFGIVGSIANIDTEKYTYQARAQVVDFTENSLRNGSMEKYSVIKYDFKGKTYTANVSYQQSVNTVGKYVDILIDENNPQDSTFKINVDMAKGLSSFNIGLTVVVIISLGILILGIIWCVKVSKRIKANTPPPLYFQPVYYQPPVYYQQPYYNQQQYYGQPQYMNYPPQNTPPVNNYQQPQNTMPNQGGSPSGITNPPQAANPQNENEQL